MSYLKRPTESQPQLDTTIRVETPERISFHYQAVGPFRRLMAFFLDIMIVSMSFAGVCLCAFVLFLMLAWLVPYLFSNSTGRFLSELFLSQIGLLVVIYALAFWFYGGVCETLRNGQTWGKQISSIRVISTDGSAIDGVQAMARNLFRLLDVMPFLPASVFFVFDNYTDAPKFPLFLVGLVCMVLSPKFQRVGDLIAGTMVVLVERDWVTTLASFEDPRVAQLAELIPSDFIVTPTLATALASFVESAPRLGVGYSNEIASEVAQPLMRKFNFPSNTDNTLLMYALYYKAFSDFEASS